MTAQGKTAAAHKGLVHVAKVMACTAVDVLQDDLLLARAKADHQARVGRTPYVCPLPDELDPPLKIVRVDRGGRFIVRSGERGQTNFLSSLLNLERVSRPEYLLADHQRPVEYETTLAAPIGDRPAPARRALHPPAARQQGRERHGLALSFGLLRAILAPVAAGQVRSMSLVRYRQTKGAATDMVDLQPPASHSDSTMKTSSPRPRLNGRCWFGKRSSAAND